MITGVAQRGPVWRQSPINWAHPLNYGLLGWWMDVPGVPSLGTVARNLAGTPNAVRINMASPATSTSGPQVSARPGGTTETRYDGLDDVMEAAIDPRFTDLPQLTVSAWIRLTSFGYASLGRILDKRTSVGWNVLVNDFNFPAGVQFTQEFSTSRGSWGVRNVLTLGPWYHLALTYDATSVSTVPTIFVNGRAQALTDTLSTPSGTRGSDSAVPLRIGNEDSFLRGFDGAIDDVRVWKRLLSAAEIAAVYVTSQDGSPGLLHRRRVLRVPVPLAPPTGMTHVVDRVSTYGNGVDTLASAAFTPGAGNLLVVTVVLYASGVAASATVSDNVNGAYTQAFLRTNPSDPNQGIAQYYRNNVAGASTIVTVNGPTTVGDYMQFTISEYAGQDPSAGVLDAATVTATGTSTTPTVVTAALAQAQNAAVGIMSFNGGVARVLTPGAGWTQVAEYEDNSVQVAFNTERRLVSSPSALTVDWTMNISTLWFAGVGVYKAAPAKAPPPRRPSWRTYRRAA